MKDINKIFEKDFKNMMGMKQYMTLNGRRGHPFNLQEVPIPIKVGKSEEEVENEVYITGLTEPFFDKLNDTEAKIVEGSDFKKPFYNADGTLYRSKINGEVKYDEIKVKPGFVAIKSPVNIDLKSEIEVRGKLRPHNPSSGFYFVNSEKEGNEKWYIYIIPRENLHKMNYSALVLSYTKINRYYGYKLAFTNGYFVYLFVVPFSNAKRNDNIHVIGVKSDVDFTKELNYLLEYWVANGNTFHPYLTDMGYDTNKQKHINLGTEKIEGNISKFRKFRGQGD